MMASLETPSRLQGAGVLLRTIEKGDGLTFPKKGDTCLIHFDAFLEDGTKIDSSRDRQLPLEFQVGKGQVVLGLDVGIQKMSKGCLAELTIPPLFAYGSAGCPPNVPPDAVLVYRIELLKIQQ